MSVVLILAGVVGLAGVVWWQRRCRAGQGRMKEARPCYHGVARHDPDWEA